MKNHQAKTHPSLYDIQLTLDPDREAYTGRVCAHYPAMAATSLLMHARDLEIQTCVLSAPGAADTELPFTMDRDRETLEIHTHDALGGRPAEQSGAPGAFTLTVSFSGTLRHDNRGIYLAAYHDQGTAKNAIVSQFEETDARKAFPCVDEPAAKAVYRISLIIPARCAAISNGDIAREEPIAASPAARGAAVPSTPATPGTPAAPGADGAGSKLVVFQDTPVMSSYLVFIAVGEFSSIEKVVEGISFRAYAVAGKARLGARALDFAAESLLHLIRYTGAPYPFKKLDLIACPDFAFGAMENYAAISYRENYMLFDAAAGSRDELERIGQITSHEVAHMWFGDLVSPAGWDCIWLNESLATYFGYLVNDTTHPEWDGMHRFMLDSFQGALERDSLDSTIPVEFPDGKTYGMSPAITSIIYSKAASVLRMMHRYLGDSSFREVIKSFLEKYAYGIAGSDQFLDCFAPFIDRSVPAAWMRREGYPVVRAELRGNRIALSQQRFKLCAGAVAGPNPTAGEPSQPWPIPLCLSLFHADGRREERTILFNTAQLDLDIDLREGSGIAALELNTARGGFYRVFYSPELLERLGRSMRKGSLDEDERAGIIDDLFAFLHAEMMEPSVLLDFLSRWCMDERSYLPLASAARGLTLLHALACGDNAAHKAMRASIAATAGRLLAPWLAEHGFRAAADEPFSASYLRTDIMTTLFHMKDPGVLAILGAMKIELAAGVPQDPNLEGLILKAGAAAYLGAATDMDPEYFLSRIEGEQDEAKRVRLISALLCFEDTRDIERIFASLEKRVPMRHWSTVVAQARLTPKARASLLDWYRRRHAALDSIHPFHAAKIMHDVIVWGALGQPEKVKSELRTLMLGQRNTSPETIQMAFEYLGVYDRTAGKLGL